MGSGLTCKQVPLMVPVFAVCPSHSKEQGRGFPGLANEFRYAECLLMRALRMHAVQRLSTCRRLQHRLLLPEQQDRDL